MLILASGSPRRREVLRKFIDEFRMVPSKADESCELTDPKAFALEVAKRKAREVFSRTYGTVIGADTVVSIAWKNSRKTKG